MKPKRRGKNEYERIVDKAARQAKKASSTSSSMGTPGAPLEQIKEAPEPKTLGEGDALKLDDTDEAKVTVVNQTPRQTGRRGAKQ